MRKLSTLALVFFAFNATAQCWDKIACGYNSLSINLSGNLFYCGDSNQSTAINIFTQKNNDNDWNDVFSGNQFCYAKKNNGSIWSWGFNGSGQLGNGTNGNITTSVPAQVGTDTNWYVLSTGAAHILGLKNDNSLWSWGNNVYGQ
jgi:alpha-tubulin suppressor-like RCC1 family protein